jgi:hypothetical protein
MAYPDSSNTYCGPDVTHLAKQSQASILGNTKRTKPLSPFGARLKQAFGGATGRDIGKKLDYSDSQMSSILAGQAEMPFDKLILVAELTKCSLHWLITGEGGDTAGPLGFIPETPRRIVQELAAGREVDVEQLVGELLTKGLAAELSEKAGRLTSLDEKERAELRVLSELITDAEK